mmetsp:Transcript_49552/g.149355  ORF Transcript_49552/g.149355 Transcript_49552/m.149355 type:complete len:653 (-) Transcript_49552:150-2108(-)
MISRSAKLLAAALALTAPSTADAFQPPSSSNAARTRSPLSSPSVKTVPAGGVHRPRRRTSAPTASTSSAATALDAVPAAAASAASAPSILSALSALESPLGSVSVLAFVVLIHELGHFLAARSLGISVREFSVGVGPKIAGFSRTVGGGDDDETAAAAAENGEEEDDRADVIDFNLRAIPLGGYVRFPENYNSTLAIEIEDENRELRREQRERREELKDAAVVVEKSKKSSSSSPAMGSEGRDASDMVMGASDTPTGFMRFLTFGDLVTGRDAREEEKMRKKAEEKKAAAEKVSKGQGPQWKNWFGLAANKANAEEEDDPLKREPRDIEYYDDPDLLQNRPWFQRAVVLSGGVVFNIALAFACYFGELTVGSGLPRPTFDQGALITQNPRGDGAGYGVLRKGDVIVGVNGDSLSRSLSPRTGEAQEDISRFIVSIRSAEEGKHLQLSVLRPTADVSAASDVRSLAKAERAPVEVSVSPRPQRNEFGEASGPMSIGVMLAPNYQGTDLVKSENAVDAAVKAGTAVREITSDTARSVFQLLGGLLMGKGAPAGQSVSGPIGVIKAGSDVVSTNDFRAVVGFAAAISINLAVINSLPLPALDGGQLVFVLAEGLTGRKIDQRLQENINAAVVLLLLLVSVGTTIGDVEAIAKGFR